MAKFKVLLGRLIRQQAVVYVEAESEEDLENRLSEVYENYDDSNWVDDDLWGCDEGTHSVVDELDDDQEVDVSLIDEEVED